MAWVSFGAYTATGRPLSGRVLRLESRFDFNSLTATHGVGPDRWVANNSRRAVDSALGRHQGRKICSYTRPADPCFGRSRVAIFEPLFPTTFRQFQHR